LPIVNGFAEIKVAEINKKPFTFALFSRRSRHRAGTRYFSRGVDAQGNVSNFNETEQIVVADSGSDGSASALPGGQIILAHVQTRGSIPIYWTQINNVKYTPKLKIFDNPETVRFAERYKRFSLVLHIIKTMELTNTYYTLQYRTIHSVSTLRLRNSSMDHNW
jgi:hypothetical protein